MLAPESARRLGAAYAAPAIRGAAPSVYRAPAMQMQEAAPDAPVAEATPPPYHAGLGCETLTVEWTVR